MLTKKTGLIAAAALIALAGTTQARDAAAQPQDVLPPAGIINKMVGEGHDLRALDLERGIYAATIRAPSGQLATFAVDAKTGELLPQPAKLSPTTAPEVSLNAVDAMIAASGEGHWNLSELKWKQGAYVVEARDDTGTEARFTIDPNSGKVTDSRHR